MENVHRLAIQKSWTSIINSLSCKETSSVIDYLVEHNILTIGLSEGIKCEKHVLEQNRKLMSTLQRRGPSAFEIFIEALLQNDLNHIADIVLSNVRENKNTGQTTTTTVSMGGADPKTFTPAQSTTGSNPIDKAVARDVNLIMDNTECNICMDNKISVALNPCGHTFCSDCGHTFLTQKTCCYCHQSVSSLIRIFV